MQCLTTACTTTILFLRPQVNCSDSFKMRHKPGNRKNHGVKAILVKVHNLGEYLFSCTVNVGYSFVQILLTGANCKNWLNFFK